MLEKNFLCGIREQFPELKKYSRKRKKGTTYEALEERREEIYDAALGAVNHGVTSTEACATARLRSGWEVFEEAFGDDGNPLKRAKGLEKFTRAIEGLSISLGGDKHYTESRDIFKWQVLGWEPNSICLSGR